MKIRQNIDEYDVKSLSAITSTVESIQKKCHVLEELSLIMQRNIEYAQNDFTSENMERAKEIIKKYNQRLVDAQVELTELLKSVDEFTEKLRQAWRPW